MAEDIDTLVRGLEVDLGQIEKSLAGFWEGGEAVATRASLVNLAVYSSRPGALEENTRLISDLTREHACRALLIATDPAASQSGVRAWINAHCHITKAGAKQVCCEQISFQINGAARNSLANIVFAHLDSDLPLYFWWQGDFDPPLCSHLWGWVDRLLYDSRDWQNPATQFGFLEASVVAPRRRVALCDLDWTRIVYFRQGLAQMFDHPQAASQVQQITRVHIVHSRQGRSTALLIAGWLAAQLNWSPDASRSHAGSTPARRLCFTRSGGLPSVEVAFEEQPGAPVGRVSLHAPQLEVRLERAPDADYMHGTLCFGGQCEIPQMLPAGRDPLADVLNEELVRGGQHKVYLRALEMLGLMGSGSALPSLGAAW